MRKRKRSNWSCSARNGSIHCVPKVREKETKIVRKYFLGSLSGNKWEFSEAKAGEIYSAKEEGYLEFYSQEFLADALSCILSALSDLYILEDFWFHWEHVRLISINIPALKFGGDMKAIERKLLPEFPILSEIALSLFKEKEATDEKATFALDTETWRNLYCGLLFFREHKKLRDELGKNIYKSKTKTERLYLKHLKLKLSHELFHQTTAKWSPDVKKHGIWTKKAIPLLEVLTELRKFMFFLKHHDEFKELEQWYKEEESYYSLFSHAYFDGVVIFLSLFDFDLFWVEREGEKKNLIAPLISAFLDIKDQRSPFKFAQKQEILENFKKFYELIYYIYPNMIMNLNSPQNVSYKDYNIAAALEDYAEIVENKVDSITLLPLFGGIRFGYNSVELYSYIFPLTVNLNWLLKHKRGDLLKTLESKMNKYKFSESYYSIEDAYINLDLIKRREERGIMVIERMDQEKGGYKGNPALQEVKKEISEIRKLIKAKKMNLVNVEATVLSLNRWLSIIEKVDGPHHKVDEVREEVNELIELRKSKGSPEYPTYLPEIHEWLVERAKKHPWRKNPPGFIID